MHFSPLPVKNKPHEGVMTHVFILRPVSMVVNKIKILLIFSYHPTPTLQQWLYPSAWRLHALQMIGGVCIAGGGVRLRLRGGVHIHEISWFVFHIFWHHSVIHKAEVQNFKNLVKLSVKSSYKIRFSWIPYYCQKRMVSLHVFGENVGFHSAYLAKSHNSASSLKTLYTAESAQFYSVISLTTISLTPQFRCKREVWFRFFAENAQNDPKTHSYEDNAKFDSSFLATTLS